MMINIVNNWHVDIKKPKYRIITLSQFSLMLCRIIYVKEEDLHILSNFKKTYLCHSLKIDLYMLLNMT